MYYLLKYIRFLRCWSGYNLSSYFWILEGPRFAVILVRMLKQEFSNNLKNLDII
jgi:hypothetical protein